MRFLLFCYLLTFSIPLYGKSLNIETLLKRVDQFFKNYPEYQGDFELQENKKVSYGKFYFKFPNIFKLIFKNIQDIGKIIMVDDKILWMYLPSEKLIIDQDIYLNSKLEKQVLSPVFSLKRILIPGYYKFENYEINLVKKKEFSFPIYPIEIQTHNKNIGFKKMILFIKENGLIVFNKIIYQDQSEFSFTRKNLNFTKISNDIFFKGPIPGVSVLKNPFYF